MKIWEDPKSFTLKIEIEREDGDFLYNVFKCAAELGDFNKNEIDRLHIMSNSIDEFTHSYGISPCDYYII